MCEVYEIFKKYFCIFSRFKKDYSYIDTFMLTAVNICIFVVCVNISFMITLLLIAPQCYLVHILSKVGGVQMSVLAWGFKLPLHYSITFLYRLCGTITWMSPDKEKSRRMKVQPSRVETLTFLRNCWDRLVRITLASFKQSFISGWRSIGNDRKFENVIHLY